MEKSHSKTRRACVQCPMVLVFLLACLLGVQIVSVSTQPHSSRRVLGSANTSVVYKTKGMCGTKVHGRTTTYEVLMTVNERVAL